MTTTTGMTAEETTQHQQMTARLAADGYQPIDRHRNLTVGARIRHDGHRYPEAHTHGTGVILALYCKALSSWSHSHGRPDIELIALWDEPGLAGRLSQVADYHVERVYEDGPR